MALRPSIVYSAISEATPSAKRALSLAAAFSTIFSICLGVNGSK